MMVKEKDRLEKYGKTMGRNQKETAVAWRDIRGEIVKAKRNMPDPLPPTDEGATDQPQEEKKTFKIPAHLKRQSWDY